MKLESEDGKSYQMPFNGRNKVTEKIFYVVLPFGQYTSKFYDDSGDEAIPTSVNVLAHTTPKCTNYVMKIRYLSPKFLRR